MTNTQKNSCSDQEWVVESQKVPGDDRAFDVTIKKADGNVSEVRVLTMD